jgi:hypothetical protein
VQSQKSDDCGKIVRLAVLEKKNLLKKNIYSKEKRD